MVERIKNLMKVASAQNIGVENHVEGRGYHSHEISCVPIVLQVGHKVSKQEICFPACTFLIYFQASISYLKTYGCTN